MRDAVGHLLAEAVGKTLPFRIITGAHFGGEGETGRHRQADRGHLRQIRALTAEEVPVPGLALRDAAAEAEDIADSEIRLHEINAPHRSPRTRKTIRSEERRVGKG